MSATGRTVPSLRTDALESRETGRTEDAVMNAIDTGDCSQLPDRMASFSTRTDARGTVHV
jgi:hypothetical protein